ncbi:MAG: hypothetical protein AAFQ08_04140, partial [Bacteroidota bacterium]
VSLEVVLRQASEHQTAVRALTRDTRQKQAAVHTAQGDSGREKKRYAQALQAYQQAVQFEEALQGDASAARLVKNYCWIGEMYANGCGAAQDHRAAAVWYQKAAEQGNARAQCSLAWMHYKGQGVEQDHQQAFEWLEKAAQQRYSLAQVRLGLLYMKGHGTPKDTAKAEECYKQAFNQALADASQKDAEAQYTLGWMHEYGLGKVQQDSKQAIEYYQNAAQHGHIAAQKAWHKLQLAQLAQLLQQAAADKDDAARAATRRALQELVSAAPTAEIRDALLKAAEDKNWQVREAAASALVELVKAAPQLASDAMRNALLKAMGDSRDNIVSNARAAAASALG